MIVFVLRRFLWAIVLLWLVTLFSFGLLHLIPGNPAVVLAGVGAKPAQVAALERSLGLNQSLAVQYWKYLVGLVHLNFGRSATTGDAVSTDLAHYFPATIELGVISFFVFTVLAMGLGTWSAWSQGSLGEGAVRIAAIIGSGMPVFWLAAILQLIFFSRLNWLPQGGELAITATAPHHYTGIFLIDSLLAGQWSLFGQTLVHLILPVATIVLAMLAVGLRSTRASVLLELGRPYVRTAEAKGVGQMRLLLIHVIRNALNPVLSVFSLQFGYLLGWVALVETVFSWPGIGYYLYNSLQTLDYAPILAVTLIASATFIIVNLITDLLYPVIDPRLRDTW